MHFEFLEAVYVCTEQPELCSKKEFVGSLSLSLEILIFGINISISSFEVPCRKPGISTCDQFLVKSCLQVWQSPYSRLSSSYMKGLS